MMDYYVDLLIRFGLNLVAMVILLFALYYPRYHHKEITITAALFNVFVFAVLSVLSSVQFSVAAGFGLFAILALFTLRSEPIDKRDIGYFFGSISLAVITSIQGTDVEFVVAMLIIVLITVYVLDHPRVLRTASGMRIKLDSIPPHVVSDPQVLRAELSKRLGVHVTSVRVLRIDYVTEVVQAEVGFKAKNL